MAQSATVQLKLPVRARALRQGSYVPVPVSCVGNQLLLSTQYFNPRNQGPPGGRPEYYEVMMYPCAFSGGSLLRYMSLSNISEGH